jgi:uncharacterized protein YjbJ (UPF0337 family)
MNWDTVEGQWIQFKGAVKSKWGKLSDQDLVMLEGKKDVFLGKLQELYGIDRDQAEKEVDDWLRTQLNPGPKKTDKSAERR